MHATDVEQGQRVVKNGGDYTFEGEIVAVFVKKTGAVRIVVENPAGILHVFNPAQVELAVE